MLTTNKSKGIAFKDLKGTYQAKYEVTDYEDPNEKTIVYSLTLYENGTYLYDYSFIGQIGEYGNYTIDGDTLTLNAWFDHGSDVGATATTRITKLKINKDGSIVDKDSHFDRIFMPENNYKKPESYTMTRASKEIEDEMEKINITERIKERLYIVNDLSQNQ